MRIPSPKDLVPSLRSRALALVALLAGFVLAGCAGPGPRFKEAQVLGGKKIGARRLNAGRDSYLNHCSACHGAEGDGKGIAAVGLRPPPRNFKQGKFKFAAVASGQLPNDDDLFRIVKYGLHGTAMIPWDEVPDQEIYDIIQYLKTLSERWKDGKAGEPIVPGADPWGASSKAEAIERGKKVYHGLAQCLLCHPAYEPQDVVKQASLELTKRETELRPDAFHSQLKESDYGVKLMPPDFTRDDLRSGTTLLDLYRTIASGIGGTAMPAWRGALPEEDIWAMAYYVRALVELKGTPEAAERRAKLIASHPATNVASAATAPPAGSAASVTN